MCQSVCAYGFEMFAKCDFKYIFHFNTFHFITLDRDGLLSIQSEYILLLTFVDLKKKKKESDHRRLHGIKLILYNIY